MRLEEQIRQLARSPYWQEIYISSKKCSGINLFENRTNFSGIQYLFLYWLRVYNMLYDELYQLEWENLDQEVLKDNDRVDAFLYWRSKEQERQIRKNKREDRKNRRKEKGFKIFSGKTNEEGNK